MREWDAFRAHVSQWKIDRYLVPVDLCPCKDPFCKGKEETGMLRLVLAFAGEQALNAMRTMLFSASLQPHALAHSRSDALRRLEYPGGGVLVSAVIFPMARRTICLQICPRFPA